MAFNVLWDFGLTFRSFFDHFLLLRRLLLTLLLLLLLLLLLSVLLNELKHREDI